jgi:hypothetical protein
LTEIVTSDLQVYRHPNAVVYIADALVNADFVETPYLRAEKLRLAVAPEIDQCLLTFTYGNVLNIERPDLGVEETAPQDIYGKFVKVVVTDTVYADAFAADPDTTETDQSITWFGIIEYDERETFGTIPAPENIQQGFQQLTAFGVLRLGDKEPIRTSLVDTDGTEANLFTCNSGLPFNVDPGGQFVQRGNRSTSRIDAESYAFSWEPRGRSEWTAFTAGEYLLQHHSPKLADGTVANVWEFAADTDADYITWYKITENTDGRTLKSLLDSLIPRFRGVGYYATFDTDTDKILIHVFTFNKTNVTLPDTQILKANANQRSLDFEHAFDITRATVSNTTTQQYHRVIARGEKRTTTFTAQIKRLPEDAWTSSQILGGGWDEADETEYKSAADSAADYSGLTTAQKQDRNAIYRASSDRLRDVFRRFVMNPMVPGTGWDGTIPHPHKTAQFPSYWLRGDQTTSPFNAMAYDEDEVAVDATYNGRDYVPALRIKRALPLYERYDYSGTNLADFVYGTAFTAETHPSYIPMMVYARTTEGTDESANGETADPHRYELVDRLNQSAVSSETARNWACRVHVADTEPGIEIVAEPAHFIGGTTAGAGFGWAETADKHLSSAHGGLMYTSLWATICVELTEHAEQSVSLVAPETGAPENVLIVNVPGARHDYVVPGTTVEIKDGLPIETTSGGASKDDLNRLRTIATTAAEWYSTIRQTLQLEWKQIRSAFQLGWLITDVGGQYQLTDINTPITAIEYSFGAEHQPGQQAIGSTRIETSYTALDFQ